MYLENPQLKNSARRPLPSSSTPDTYIHDPYGCDPYHNPDLYGQENLKIKETINVPFHEFVKKTNMNLDITKRRTDDNGDHPPVQYAEEMDLEPQIIVSPPAYPLKPILKTPVSNPTKNRSPTRVPAPTDEIRASMTSSPSSPQSPEHPRKQSKHKRNFQTPQYSTHTKRGPLRQIYYPHQRHFNTKPKTDQMGTDK